MYVDSQAETQRRAGCLVLCCKAPQQSKRRLAARLGDRTTAAAEKLLACALEDLADWPGEAVIAPASEQDADWLRAGPARGFEMIVQCDGSLGTRINHVDTALRSRGRERLIYIGTDCPALAPAYLSRAHNTLDDNDVVLGPAIDGGVVLMGATKPWPAIGDLAWSTSVLLEGLTQRLSSHDRTIARLDTLADVDSVEDLSAVAEQLTGDNRPARRALLDWLRSNEPLRAVIS